MRISFRQDLARTTTNIYRMDVSASLFTPGAILTVFNPTV